MSEEEQKAIEKVKEVIKIDKERRIVTLYDEKPLFRDQLQIIIDLLEKQQKLINQLIKDMKERANNFSYESEIMWRKIEKAEKLLDESNDGDHIPRID